MQKVSALVSAFVLSTSFFAVDKGLCENGCTINSVGCNDRFKSVQSCNIIFDAEVKGKANSSN